ncbi:MAG: HlyD family efflux transporter periplasmic adaptor subunit [Candidatus Solibacter usitatus]|nr:HlyD family efflux transporter periplasmic adaptor subunit [Candidatus Solibacter usitatus]
MRRAAAVKAVLALGGVAAAVVAVMRFREVQAASTLATAPARQGEFLVITKCRGELRARRSVQITAPMNVPDLRIVWLVPPNSAVKEGDAVIRFDGSSARQQLQEKEAALKQAQETLNQGVAEARITAEADRRDLASARYDVERARLEVSRLELLSAIQGEEARINLTLAENKLRVQQATGGLHEASSRSKTASLTRLQEQAQYEVDLTKDRLSRMEVKSPLTGVIVYLPNYSQGWMNAKPFKIGDQVWPGASIAVVPDLNTLEMEGKVEEIDRGRIAAGNDVRIRVDSLPELTVPARIDELSSMAQVSFDWPPTYNFRAYARVGNADPRLRPEMNGTMDVIVDRIPNAISVPAKAVFTRAGKPVVFAATARGYSPRLVEVIARNPDEVAVKGIAAGTQVALTEPETPEQGKGAGQK